jgi:hypothetical protein
VGVIGTWERSAQHLSSKTEDQFMAKVNSYLAIAAVAIVVVVGAIVLRYPLGDVTSKPVAIENVPPLQAQKSLDRATPQTVTGRTVAPSSDHQGTSGAINAPTTVPSYSRTLPSRRPEANGSRANATALPRPDQTPLIPLPVARDALSFVGVDPDAEATWVAAINDPSMPSEARKDLIEDLNEDGFNDPKHVTRDEIPLIVNRLALIEQLAPDAMDDVNYAAFAEAYKDLVSMLARLTRQ